MTLKHGKTLGLNSTKAFQNLRKTLRFTRLSRVRKPTGSEVIDRLYEILESVRSFLTEYWLLCYFVINIAYLELLYHFWIFKSFQADLIFPLLFALPAGTALYLLTGLMPAKFRRAAAAAFTLLLSVCYGTQLVYSCIFHTPLSLCSVGGAGEAMQFQDIILEAILKNALAIVLLFVPLVFLYLMDGKIPMFPRKRIRLAFLLLFLLFSHLAAIILVDLTGESPVSPRALYHTAFTPELSVNKLGVLTTGRLDLQKLAAEGFRSSFAGAAAARAMAEESAGTRDIPAVVDEAGYKSAANAGTAENSGGSSKAGTPAANEMSGAGPAAGSAAEEAAAGGVAAVSGATGRAAGSNAEDAVSVDGPAREAMSAAVEKPYNTMNINFARLLTASGQDNALHDINQYFSAVKPTATNRYTGMFKGCNLILLTAEAFSPYVVSPELTPTLYSMIHEGFYFTNFYNPVWGVSTSDGEYAGCIGLIPKSGVWSFAASGKDYLPFALGNQFRKLGYVTKAYHDHTYTYYKRNISHPNMGYDYKGYGNGLVVKKTWPESDLEMINVTAPEYIGSEPFHVYYMTVSGHMNYSFTGNYMAAKNRKLVAGLPYSDTVKAYIACNLELEAAMKALIQKLEDAGIAEKTVIALSPDHYPYGLPRECIDEAAGHKVEDNFELYKSTLIIWKKGMKPITVNKPCASLDRIPTLSNLFGLEYDSRLLAGSDILSDSPALVIFSNRSWITDRARYNTVTNRVEFLDGTTEDKAYVRKVNRIVADKFKYSAKILDMDYYRKVFNQFKK